MADKTIVNPKRVRGLGNIVSPKTTTDFLGFNSKVSSSTALVDDINRTVYESTFLEGSYLTLTHVESVSTDATSFTVTALLNDNTDNVISSAGVYCVVNGAVYTATTDNEGVATFTVPCDNSNIYSIRVYYPGTNSVAGCFKTSKVVCVDGNNLTLFILDSVVQTGETVNLFAELEGITLDEKIVKVPSQTIYFYEEYIPSLLSIMSNKSVIQNGETVNFALTLVDSDGSRIKDETINIYEVYTPTDLEVKISDNIIESGDTTSIVVTLRDSDGSRIKDETINIYEGE